jgi:hypothetical protein
MSILKIYNQFIGRLNEWNILIIGSITLVSIAMSGVLSRFNNIWSFPIFWISTLTFYTLCVSLFFNKNAKRSTILGTSLMLTAVASSIQLVLYPLYWVDNDELDRC